MSQNTINAIIAVGIVVTNIITAYVHNKSKTIINTHAEQINKKISDFVGEGNLQHDVKIIKDAMANLAINKKDVQLSMAMEIVKMVAPRISTENKNDILEIIDKISTGTL